MLKFSLCALGGFVGSVENSILSLHRTELEESIQTDSSVLLDIFFNL